MRGGLCSLYSCQWIEPGVTMGSSSLGLAKLLDARTAVDLWSRPCRISLVLRSVDFVVSSNISGK